MDIEYDELLKLYRSEKSRADAAAAKLYQSELEKNVLTKTISDYVLTIKNLEAVCEHHKTAAAEHEANEDALTEKIERLQAERGNYDDKDAIKVLAAQRDALAKELAEAKFDRGQAFENAAAAMKELRTELEQAEADLAGARQGWTNTLNEAKARERDLEVELHGSREAQEEQRQARLQAEAGLKESHHDYLAARTAWVEAEKLKNAAEAEVKRLMAECDTEMERVKACEHIAEGDEGWEKLKDICPSTMAVAHLREVIESRDGQIEALVAGCGKAHAEVAALKAKLAEWERICKQHWDRLNGAEHRAAKEKARNERLVEALELCPCVEPCENMTQDAPLCVRCRALALAPEPKP